MAAETSTDGQLELDFPDPEDFPSYDETDSAEGEAELPADSFDENSVLTGEDGTGCCVR